MPYRLSFFILILTLLVDIQLATANEKKPEFALPPTVLHQTKCLSNTSYQAKQKKKYERIAKEICQTWSTLNQLPEDTQGERNSYNEAKDSLRRVLLTIYQERLNKQSQANFIENATSSRFEDAVLRITTNKIDDFPDL